MWATWLPVWAALRFEIFARPGLIMENRVTGISTHDYCWTNAATGTSREATAQTRSCSALISYDACHTAMSRSQVAWRYQACHHPSVARDDSRNSQAVRNADLLITALDDREIVGC